LELESQVRSIEGALRGVPEGSCLYQYTRVMSGFPLPRRAKYPNPVTEVFASNRLAFLEKTASLTYDPKRLKGANVYQEVAREFATGDRIQFSAPDKALGINNRDLATIAKMNGNITVQMDGKDGRVVSFDPSKMRNFDHGYAVTSHSSQGFTEIRVIANIDTETSRSLINTRLAYVAISRASDDARIYTNDAGTLGARLSIEVTKTAAVDFRQVRRAAQEQLIPAQIVAPESVQHRRSISR
jgi:hypothetical protein